ncbi:DUF7261 family protein [Halorubrum vacuolatum]|uniref:Uncharacterized protein n=1 Tax=Halorubrum vacuolatum TaxID=63740 RepID=A0A238X2W4_HALVU|nr:hypothetical protein [Halorubrum vacuolatum]SNR53306.1 hypothetical protein SAMN06264855_11317 [Halorubrum vacuolatum]
MNRRRLNPVARRLAGRGDDRGQLILVAAAALAIALFPLVLAYLQLGYAGDVDAEPTGTDPESELTQALERAVHDAAAEVDHRTTSESGAGESTDDGGVGDGHIDSPEGAAAAFRTSASDDLKRIETAYVADGSAARIEYAPTGAETWIDDGHWRDGIAGDFSEPTAHGGVVIQERGGEPTVIAVAVDVHLRTPEATIDRRVIVHVPR